jgi:hypothetical protein
MEGSLKGIRKTEHFQISDLAYTRPEGFYNDQRRPFGEGRYRPGRLQPVRPQARQFRKRQREAPSREGRPGHDLRVAWANGEGAEAPADTPAEEVAFTTFLRSRYTQKFWYKTEI